MKPGTNLFLRSLIGKEKTRLIEEKALILSHSLENADRIIQIDQSLKALNSTLSELKEESKKKGQMGTNHSQIVVDEYPAPTLSPEVIENVRGLLRDNERATVGAVKDILGALERVGGSPSWIAAFDQFQKEKALARRSLDEFNAVYPEKK